VPARRTQLAAHETTDRQSDHQHDQIEARNGTDKTARPGNDILIVVTVSDIRDLVRGILDDEVSPRGPRA